jgi:TerC family integral membrane protein
MPCFVLIMDRLGWILATVTLAASLALDLILHRRGRSVSVRAAAVWTSIWVAIGLSFGLVILALRGPSAMQDYYAAYLIEQSLSLDNLFVFLLIFQSLRVPEDRQHEVLFYGVLGALFFRAVFVFAGSAALERWHWVDTVFGALLLVAAVRALTSNPGGGESRLLGWLSRRLPVTERLHGTKFLARQDGKLMVTPLLLALIGLELSDIMFAIDSVPAALSITQDRFIVYTSNAFAICGLRSMYLLLNRFLLGLRHLHYGIAGVLLFTGSKMIGQSWLHVPSWLSIVITLSCITLSVAASLLDRGVRQEPVS